MQWVVKCVSIKLELEEYCKNCRNFEAKTIKRSDSDQIRVECEHRQQCKIQARYLFNQIKYGSCGQNGNY